MTMRLSRQVDVKLVAKVLLAHAAFAYSTEDELAKGFTMRGGIIQKWNHWDGQNGGTPKGYPLSELSRFTSKITPKLAIGHSQGTPSRVTLVVSLIQAKQHPSECLPIQWSCLSSMQHLDLKIDEKQKKQWNGNGSFWQWKQNGKWVSSVWDIWSSRSVQIPVPNSWTRMFLLFLCSGMLRSFPFGVCLASSIVKSLSLWKWIYDLLFCLWPWTFDRDLELGMRANFQNPKICSPSTHLDHESDVWYFEF